MKKNINPEKFVNQAEEVYQNALNATIELLKNNGSKQYVVSPDLDDEVEAISWDEVPITIWGVGLNNDNHICVKAFVCNVGYGHTEDEFPEEWTDITETQIYASAYPDIYRFVAENLDAAIDEEAAEKVELE